MQLPFYSIETFMRIIHSIRIAAKQLYLLKKIKIGMIFKYIYTIILIIVDIADYPMTEK